MQKQHQQQLVSIFHWNQLDSSSINYLLAAVKGLGKKLGKVAATTVEKKIMPVEEDPHKLVNYVCGSNYFIEGEDVKVNPDL